MTSITHVIVGASIAAKITNPYSAFVTAFAAHLICDAIPHWDLGTNWRFRPKTITGVLAILENLLSLLGGLVIFTPLVPNSTSLVWALIASLLPDWLEAPYYLFPKGPKIFYYIYKAQSFIHGRSSLWVGIMTQVVIAGLFLILGFS